MMVPEEKCEILFLKKRVTCGILIAISKYKHSYLPPGK